MPGPPPRQHEHERRYTAFTHTFILTRRIWEDDYYGQIIFGNLVGLKLPDICLRGEENSQKKKKKNPSPRKPVPTGDRTQVRCATGAHATAYAQRSTILIFKLILLYKFQYFQIKSSFKETNIFCISFRNILYKWWIKSNGLSTIFLAWLIIIALTQEKTTTLGDTGSYRSSRQCKESHWSCHGPLAQLTMRDSGTSTVFTRYVPMRLRSLCQSERTTARDLFFHDDINHIYLLKAWIKNPFVISRTKLS